MTSRALPPEEWHRLSETDLPALLPFAAREDVAIVVVERGGRIVAASALMWFPHIEGAWVAPEYRKRRVFARLVDAFLAMARDRAVMWAFAGSASDEMTRLLTKHLRAVKVPMETYVMSTEQPCRH